LAANVEGAAVSLNFQNGCFTGKIATTPINQCSNAKDQAKALQMIPSELRPIARRLLGLQSQIGLVTVQVGGRYYVSPTRTLFHNLNAFLSDIEPSDLTTVENNLPAIEKQIAAGEKAIAGQVSVPGLS
jgi:hypothetical protein